MASYGVAAAYSVIFSLTTSGVYKPEFEIERHERPVPLLPAEGQRWHHLR